MHNAKIKRRNPPRVEYTATEKTTDLTPMFEYFCRWGVYHQY
ncbi:winged helix-turn-helix transcriptional regulator [Haladaptatus pallidirubidus]